MSTFHTPIRVLDLESLEDFDVCVDYVYENQRKRDHHFGSRYERLMRKLCEIEPTERIYSHEHLKQDEPTHWTSLRGTSFAFKSQPRKEGHVDLVPFRFISNPERTGSYGWNYAPSFYDEFNRKRDSIAMFARRRAWYRVTVSMKDKAAAELVLKRDKQYESFKNAYNLRSIRRLFLNHLQYPEAILDNRNNHLEKFLDRGVDCVAKVDVLGVTEARKIQEERISAESIQIADYAAFRICKDYDGTIMRVPIPVPFR